MIKLKKSSILYVFILALAFLFLTPVANALTLNSDKAEICATDTYMFLFSVTNNENFENSYTVSLTDSASRWAIAAPSGFNLKPGQSQTVYVYVTPSIAANPGNYPLKIILSSLSPNTESTTATIVVKDCHSAALSTTTSNVEVCSATEAKYYLTLENTGKYTENFILSLSGVPAKWSTLSEELVKLEPGQTKDIIVYSTPPADQTGNFALTVTAASQNSRALASTKLNLISKGCYDFSLSTETNYLSFCENSEVKIPLTIENKGSVENSYTLSVEGPVWSTVENKNLDIGAYQGKFTNLVLYPGFGVSGDFKIKVKAIPKIGQSQEQTIVANVRSCHEASLETAAKEDTICPYTSKNYAVSLVNNGEFKEKYALSVVGADFASLDKDFVELDAGKSTEFNLIVAPKDEQAGTKNIIVSAKAQGTSKTEAKAELKLNIAPMASCYGVQVTSALTTVNVAAGEPAVIPIIIENKGLENSTYNLDVSGTGAQFVQLNPASLQLEGKSTKTLYAYVAVPEQTAEDSYKVTVSARLADGTISSTTSFVIKVGKTEEEEVQKPEVETPRQKLLAFKDSIVAFFGSFWEKLKAIKLPKIETKGWKMPELNLSFLQKEETEETQKVENKTENEAELSLPENISKFLSSEVIAKLNKSKVINESNKSAQAGEAVAEKPKLQIPKLPSIEWPTFLSVQFLKEFLTERTYYIPNWLFITLVIVIVASFSYIVKRKDLIQKFNEFLEKEPEEEKGEEKRKSEKGPAAQDILNELDKEKVEKNQNKKKRAKKK